MDKTESRKEKVIKEPANPGNLIHFHVNPMKRKHLNELLGSIEEVRTTQAELLSKESTSPFRDKKESQFISSFSNMFYEVAKYAVGATFAVEYLEQRLDVVEIIIDEIGQTLKKDLPKVKSELTNLKATLNSDDFLTVSNFVQDMDKTLSKLEKNRKDILRDSVV